MKICSILGCPIAWLISNREDESVLKVFFQKIAKRCPKAHLHAILTDDGNKFKRLLFLQFLCVMTDLAGVNACRNVYLDIVHLLCKWHVDRLVYQVIIVDKHVFFQSMAEKAACVGQRSTTRAELYACLCMLINEGDRKEFLAKQLVLLEYWREKQPAFTRYYESGICSKNW